MKVSDFLWVQTPDLWLDQALRNVDILLMDHANCEKKAASTALNLMYRYVEYPELLAQLSKLAREELRHFEQVLGFMKSRNIVYRQLSSSRYAGGLRKAVRTHEPSRLIDLMLVSAIVEARSCERFSRLVSVLEPGLAEFYGSLLKSEQRHFECYLSFARKISVGPIDERLAEFLEVEAELITSEDTDFRFHSGLPAQGFS
ncbi:MAG: tRNA-(ms[2]io[6]A)-hydroxylase [Pseudomonadales bacterium]|nr:tRNA-(ms[2]io[6]A)-hydroxylase [Pseudomonadales bacterium]